MVDEESFNSYVEPSYDEHDKSEEESYEPTYYKSSKPINQLVAEETPVEQCPSRDEAVAVPQSESEGEDVDDYECTHDQQLSDLEESDADAELKPTLAQRAGYEERADDESDRPMEDDEDSAEDEEMDFVAGRRGSPATLEHQQTTRAQRQNLWMTGR